MHYRERNKLNALIDIVELFKSITCDCVYKVKYFPYREFSSNEYDCNWKVFVYTKKALEAGTVMIGKRFLCV